MLCGVVAAAAAPPADAPEEAQQVRILDHLATLITHRTHELEQPDGRIWQQQQQQDSNTTAAPATGS
jgi:hypothetical protein